MIGLVFVSHSRALAEALVGLVRQVSPEAVPIAIAAGVGPDRSEFGTDALEISEAIQSVYSSDGVLVLMDLGSAVMSAEVALDLLPDEVRSQVLLCAAPLVEGAVAAGVQAGMGSDVQTVCREAMGAVQPKAEHFSTISATAMATPEAATHATAPEPGQIESQPAISVEVVLENQHGLHARPAARFVQTAASFQAEIKVTNITSGKGPVSAKSLNALATLGAVHGSRIRISAAGQQAEDALQALRRLVEDNFGEKHPEPEPAREPEIAAAPPADPSASRAVPISEGAALGPFFRYEPPLPPVPTGSADNPDLEWERLQRALEATRLAIQTRYQGLKASLGETEAAIFEAHLLILQDPDLLSEVRENIYTLDQNAAAAWHSSIQKTAEAYQGLPDPYLRQRAADVQDVGRQVLFALAGGSAGIHMELAEPAVLFAEDLTPTETAGLDLSRVLALVMVAGGPTSHSAILARAKGIPAVSGANPALQRLAPGTLLGVDGSRGLVWIDPPPEVQTELKNRREAWLDRRKRLMQAGQQMATTRDAQRVEVVANVGSVLDARLAVENGAEGIGLLRTEFLYLTRTIPPGEDEQLASLREIGEAMGGRPVIVRTLDVGGDKPLPYIQMAPEANPFLGVRALRLSLRQPELFQAQLRAILRAGADYPFKIMFPMVANLEEVLQARRSLEQAHQSLIDKNDPHRWPIETGIMVEIPSAAVLSRSLAPHVDFFSIGTNDLTQYLFAAERGNPSLTNLQDAFHPAVLQMIREVADAAAQHAKWVGVCGELAGDPLAAPVLVGLGVTELSLSPAGIPAVKEALRSISMDEARSLAQEVLAVDSAASARSIAEAFLDARVPNA